MSDNLDDIPLPEECTLNDEVVATRKDLVEESDGNLFTRQCDNLDNTIPKRKDRFIECEELPEVPKVLLKNKQFNEVEFPGVPLAEIPKKLLAHLLPCCLEGRSAGFDFEVARELDANGDKVQISDIAQSLTAIPLSIQLGTSGYLLIGLDIKPDICFCDETCGDRDYIHLKVNLDAEYHDDDIVEDPDLEITDEQLTALISNYGGGGGGNPLCSQKLFAVYTPLGFIPYGLTSPTITDYIPASVAPYLDLQLVYNGIYKLEYFCEYNGWYVTDGQCANSMPSYSYPSYRLVDVTGLPNQTYRGTFFLDDGEVSIFTYDQFSITLDTDASGDTTPEDVFNNGITWNALSSNAERLHYSFSLKEGASGTLVYTALISSSVESCEQRAFKLIFNLQDTTPVAEEEEAPEEEGE